MATLSPASAKARAMARPMPRLPPVTRTERLNGPLPSLVVLVRRCCVDYVPRWLYAPRVRMVTLSVERHPVANPPPTAPPRLRLCRLPDRSLGPVRNLPALFSRRLSRIGGDARSRRGSTRLDLTRVLPVPVELAEPIRRWADARHTLRPARAGDPDARLDPAFLALPLRALADAALSRARELGADHADFRLERIRSAAWRLRDARLDGSLGRRGARASRCGWCTTAPGASPPASTSPPRPRRAVAEQAVEVARVSADQRRSAAETGRAGRRAGLRRRRPGSRPTRSTRSTCRTPSETALLADWSGRLLAADGVDHVDASLLHGPGEQVLRRPRRHRRPPSSGSGSSPQFDRRRGRPRRRRVRVDAHARPAGRPRLGVPAPAPAGTGTPSWPSCPSCWPRRCKAPSVEAGPLRPGDRPVQPVADHPRVDRPRHRARPRARLRGGLRRHLASPPSTSSARCSTARRS